MKENEKEQLSPFAAALGFAEEVHAVADEISSILGWSILIAGDLVGLFILTILALYFHLQFVQSFFGIYVVMSALIIGVWVAYTITQGYEVRSILKKWDANFIRFYYVLKFETFPAEGVTPQLRILNQLLSVFVNLKDSFMDYKGKRPEAEKDFLNVSIKNKHFIDAITRKKRREHFFDVYIGRHVLETKSELDNFIENYGEVFVKLFDGKKPIDDQDLSTFRAEVKDCVGKNPVFRVVAVSTSSFSESAKQYVGNKENQINGRSFDLIIDKEKGYYVEWIS